MKQIRHTVAGEPVVINVVETEETDPPRSRSYPGSEAERVLAVSDRRHFRYITRDGLPDRSRNLLEVGEMSVVEDLKTAKGHVANGWHQGSLSDRNGNVCAMGAIALAVGVELDLEDVGEVDWARHTAAHMELRKHLPISFESVPDFNDDIETTHQDVLNLFDKALADLGGLS